MNDILREFVGVVVFVTVVLASLLILSPLDLALLEYGLLLFLGILFSFLGLLFYEHTL